MLAQDFQGLPESSRNEIDNLSKRELNKRRGIGCGYILEPIPIYNKAQCEKVISGDNNAYIVFGRDRNGPLIVSGKYDNGENLGPYGPKGHTRCGIVDIVAGRHSAEPSFAHKGLKKIHPIVVDPDMFLDASRIYVAQRTDVDTNFRIGTSTNRKYENRAAIAIKSDAVRIVARESLKLVTGTDTKNSLGGTIYKIGGIELIAGNDDTDIQPLPKGDNLVESLTRLTKHVSSLNGILDAFLKYQMEFNETVMLHTHYSPFYGLPTTPSETILAKGRVTSINLLNNVQTGLYGNKINLLNFKSKYLSSSGEKYVCSRFNKVN